MNKLKINYSPSKSEFILLISLLIVAITALTVNYLILPQWTSFSDSAQRFDSENAMVENLRTEYAKLDSYKEEDAKLQTDLDGLHKVLPDYFSEEEIIASVDKNAVSSGLDVLNISFSGITTDTRGSFLAGLTMKAASANAAAPATANSSGTDSQYVQSERISLSYSGSYDNLVKFLSAYESQTRQVYFRSSTLTRADDGSLNGTLTLLVFSSSAQVAVVDDPGYPGYEFDAPAATGKDDPFAAFSSYESSSSSSTGSVSSAPDFYLILNTYDDNSSKILMGKYPVSGTQITSNDNNNTAATLTLSKTGTTCSYKYTLNSQSYSGSFALSDTDASLAVNVLSRARKSSLDNVGVTLNVQNSTGIPVNIILKNDDASNPRFHLGTTSGSVQVVK